MEGRQLKDLKTSIFFQKFRFNIKKAIQSIDDNDYQKTLVALATKKWNSLKGGTTLSRKAKTQSFLVQRGFEINLIGPIVQALNKK